MECCAEDILPSFRWMNTTGQDQCPARYICVCAILRCGNKPALTPSGREQRHMIKIHWLAKVNEMADSCTSKLQCEFCSFAKRLFLCKITRFNPIFTVLRQSLGLLGRFITVWKNCTEHTGWPLPDAQSQCNHMKETCIHIYSMTCMRTTNKVTCGVNAWLCPPIRYSVARS